MSTKSYFSVGFFFEFRLYYISNVMATEVANEHSLIFIKRYSLWYKVL